jgi:hypothetical protein
MGNDTVHIALFKEDQLEQAAEAIDKLRSFGISDKNISVISGQPFSDKILGRPMSWTRVPQIALAGAGVGFLTAMALNLTPTLYPIRVGGMPYLPIPTSIVVVFELTMLGLLISTFLGVFIETISPSFGPKGYDPRISDGYIGILFTCPFDCDEKMHSELQQMGAELIHRHLEA